MSLVQQVYKARIIWLSCLLLLPLFWSVSTERSDAACGPFSGIIADSTAAYGSYVIKLTYFGDQLKPIASIVMVGSNASFDIEEFRQHYTPGIDYGNDSAFVLSFAVTPVEIERIIDSLALIPAMIDSLPDTLPDVSMTILADSATCFEGLYNLDHIKILADLLLNALDPANTEGKKILTYFKGNATGRY